MDVSVLSQARQPITYIPQMTGMLHEGDMHAQWSGRA